MALPFLLIQGAIRATPWVIGYFITDKIADTIRPDNNAKSKSFENNDLTKYLNGDLTVPSLTSKNMVGIPSATNNGFGNAFDVKDIIKLAMLGGAIFVGFKALNEGKKLL